MGAIEIPRREYLHRLSAAVKMDVPSDAQSARLRFGNDQSVLIALRFVDVSNMR